MVELIEPFQSPCRRMVAIARAIAAQDRRFQGWSSLRFGALGLLAANGRPDEVARRFFERVDAITAALPWWSALRSDVRFCVAAHLTARERSVAEFLEALETCRSHFRSQALPKSEVHEALACLVLMEQVPSAVPTAEQVARLAAVYRGIKEFRPGLTGRDDYAAAALLASTGDSVEHIVDRVEGLYHLLHDLRFHRGNQLQLASHLLYFAAESDQALAGRFRLLFDAFERAGLWMNEGDYDEIALLASLQMPSAELVRRVLADRDRIRAELSPRPSPQQGFELASATTLLGQASTGGLCSQAYAGLGITQIVTLMQAQQVAMVAAAADHTAAAAG